MFLKMDSFLLQPNSSSTINLYNGTFEKSENVIARNRMIDVSLLGNGNRQRLSDDSWTEDGNITVLNFKSGEPGTWVAGVSTSPNNIELSATDFNDYLEHDGVLDMLEWRKQNNASDQPAVEKYSKHVKAIFQVGDKKTDDWKTPLGYPIEFVPQKNPYEVKTGESLPVQLLRNGQPLANQLVYTGFSEGAASHGHEHKEGEEHSHDATKTTTDANGIINLDISQDGHWFLRSIHMALSEEPGLTHESNWATLTFEVTHSHEPQSTGIPTALYWIAGLFVVAGVFLYLRKK